MHLTPYQQARAALERGEIVDACRRCEAILLEHPGQVDALLLAAELHLRHGDRGLAPSLAQRALRAIGTEPEPLLEATNALWEMGLRELAIDAWERALERSPHDLDLRFRQAVFQLIAGEPAEALAQCEHLLERVEQPEIHALRGLALRRLGRTDDAILAYVTALRDDPQRVEWWCHIGDLRMDQRRLDEAIRAYHSALIATQRRPDTPPARLASILSKLADCFARSNMLEEAWGFSEQALAIQPAGARALWTDLALLPVIYESSDQTGAVRERYERRLADLDGRIPLGSAERRREAIAGLKLPFYLHYQGGDMRPIMERYGALVDRLAKAWQPDLPSSLPMPPVHGRIRVGFASYLFRRHTITKLFGGWIRGLDRRRFEVFGYHLGPEIDETTRGLQATCDHFVHIPALDAAAACRRIRQDDLHVLIFPELGMAKTPYLVAALRGAPVQAVAWGHPITTGLPEVDLFLTSDAMEPDDGEEHYTEQLVRLPGLSITVEPPVEPSTRSLADLGLSDTDVHLLIPQSLFKLLPVHDDVLARILARVPRGRLVFLQHRTDAVTNLFRRRLERALEARGVAADRLVFLPQQKWSDYLALNAAADVFLDGLSWSGGMTTLEALAMGLVPVTCPGGVMRARHTAAILDELGLPELIAEDSDEYVDIAVALATDPALRHNLVRAIEARLPDLRADPRVLPALESAIEGAVAERLPTRVAHQRKLTETSGTR